MVFESFGANMQGARNAKAYLFTAFIGGGGIASGTEVLYRWTGSSTDEPTVVSYVGLDVLFGAKDTPIIGFQGPAAGGRAMAFNGEVVPAVVELFDPRGGVLEALMLVARPSD